MFFFSKKFPFGRSQESLSEQSLNPDSQTKYTDSFLELEGPPDALVTISGQHYHYFGGNAFLGLQSHPSVLASACEAVLRYGTGAGTNRFCLTATPILKVEHTLSDILSTERTFYYNSDLLGPQIILDTLRGTFDRVIVDEAIDHYVLETVKLRCPGETLLVFNNNDPDHLIQVLKKNIKKSERPLLLTSGVFSALGTIAPLPSYAQILSAYNDASMIIDDSFGFGILGQNGFGTYEHFGLAAEKINRTKQDELMPMDEIDFFEEYPSQNGEFPADDMKDLSTKEDSNHYDNSNSLEKSFPVHFYTSSSLSNALGGAGGFISGTTRFIDQIAERSGELQELSPPASPLAAATSKCLEITFRDGAVRKQLIENTLYFRKKLRELGLPVDETPVPIVSLSLGTNSNMRHLRQRLSEEGILVTYLPAYPGNTPDGALRISIFASHTEEMLDHFIDRFRRLI